MNKESVLRMPMISHQRDQENGRIGSPRGKKRVGASRGAVFLCNAQFPLGPLQEGPASSIIQSWAGPYGFRAASGISACWFRG